MSDIIKSNEFIKNYDQILSALSIQRNKIELIESFKKYDDAAKYKLITTVKGDLDKLLQADEKLVLFFKDKKSLRNEWRDVRDELGRLQGLILLRKTSADCEDLIKNILGAFKNKLAVINDILTKDLNQTGGAYDMFGGVLTTLSDKENKEILESVQNKIDNSYNNLSDEQRDNLTPIEKAKFRQEIYDEKVKEAIEAKKANGINMSMNVTPNTQSDEKRFDTSNDNSNVNQPNMNIEEENNNLNSQDQKEQTDAQKQLNTIGNVTKAKFLLKRAMRAKQLKDNVLSKIGNITSVDLQNNQPSITTNSNDNSVENIIRNYLTNMLASLGITDSSVINKIISDININSREDLDLIQSHSDEVTKLMVQDEQLMKDLNTITNNETKKQVQETLKELAKLQTLILIRKKPKNCDVLMTSLLSAFKDKISTVNNILVKNLEDEKPKEIQEGGTETSNFVGGNDNKFKQKYFKYKSKYLNLLKK